MRKSSGFKSQATLGIIAYLRFHPEGGHCEELAVAAGIGGNAATKSLHKMFKRGHIRVLKEPTDNLPRRNRYYLPEFEERAKAAHEASYGVTWGRGLRAQKAKWKLPPPVVARKPITSSVTPSRWAVQSLPFESFFGNEGYRTNHIGNDTWAAKVYAY